MIWAVMPSSTWCLETGSVVIPPTTGKGGLYRDYANNWIIQRDDDIVLYMVIQKFMELMKNG